MPSPIQTNLTLGLDARTAGATAMMSSCPLSSNRRATVAKAISSPAKPSSRRTSWRGRRGVRNASASMPLYTVRNCSGRPTPAASAWAVIASQTLTIAWARRAAHRSSAI